MANDIDIASLAAELRALISRLKRRLREQGSVGDLTPSQIAALRRLDRDGPATVSNLARAEGVRPQSMGVTVAALEAAGLVAGAPDPNDGRQTLISTTPLCVEKLARGRAARQDWLARQIVNLSSEEQAQLAAAADILRRISES
ncbi:MarR family winged helix-turn-helix transcriptional regulator [Microvirga puerhi]|uniref:MarR family transcriptional regulator n=1 Tax=Microvirga puerhi TaxID=2876078 RepID=A0ABS7VT07_9HYPH|nr:MarR family transcriptional regulator [Microvirga puerhi]MBZ6078674.1 MarR family transcriptional regulator [Microvirga puerhi]